MKLITRWLLAFILVPLSGFIGVAGVLWNLFTFRRAKREYEALKEQGRLAVASQKGER